MIPDECTLADILSDDNYLNIITEIRVKGKKVIITFDYPEEGIQTEIYSLVTGE